MLRTTFRAVASALVLSLPLVAQAGNELVFVGTSTSGMTDPHLFVESATMTVADRGGINATNNVTDAVWTDSGRTLYVANGLAPGGISVAQWNGTTSSWSQLHASSRGCYGLGLDVPRQRLWTLASASGYNELHCIDLVSTSPTYGAAIAQTNTLSGPIRERWALSPTGNFALVPHLLLGSGTVDLVDTNPANATFSQVILSLPLIGAISSGISMVADCAFTPDEQHALLVYTGPGFAKIAALHLPSGMFVDFDANVAGQQDYSLGLSVATSMAVSASSLFGVVTGLGGGGWVARIAFDWTNAGNTTHTNLTPAGGLPNCNAASIAPDEARFAVTNWTGTAIPPAYLSIYDLATGSLVQRLTMQSVWNAYTTAWQDRSPLGSYTPFGAGCAGVVGVPELRAVAGSRPGLGLAFAQSILNVPSNIAIASLGFSTSSSGGIPLPLELTVVGMPGCTMWIDPAQSTFLFTATTTATVSYVIPNDPFFFGLPFFTQGWALDPAANAAGWIATDGGTALIGL